MNRCRHLIAMPERCCRDCYPPPLPEVRELVNSAGVIVHVRFEWDATTCGWVTAGDNAGERYTETEIRDLLDLDPAASHSVDRKMALELLHELQVTWGRTWAGIRWKWERLHPEAYTDEATFPCRQAGKKSYGRGKAWSQTG